MKCCFLILNTYNKEKGYFLFEGYFFVMFAGCPYFFVMFAGCPYFLNNALDKVRSEQLRPCKFKKLVDLIK